MAVNDFIMTVNSDEEEEHSVHGHKASKIQDGEDAQLNPDFTFDMSGDMYDDILGDNFGLADVVLKGRPVGYFFRSPLLN